VRRKNEAFNPFYLALVVIGIAFAITACVYGVMIVLDLQGSDAALAAAHETSLLKFMDAYGGSLLAAELVVLAICTIAAISTDQFWQRRAIARQAHAEKSANREADSTPR
jgi:ABC-type sulfate transport system permease subunit